MSPAATIMREHRRLALLRILAEAPGYAANEAILTDMIRGQLYRVTADTVRADLSWLAEQELVTVEEIGGLMIATVTERGVEVAQGYAVHPGVKRPGPGG